MAAGSDGWICDTNAISVVQEIKINAICTPSNTGTNLQSALLFDESGPCHFNLSFEFQTDTWDDITHALADLSNLAIITDNPRDTVFEKLTLGVDRAASDSEIHSFCKNLLAIGPLRRVEILELQLRPSSVLPWCISNIASQINNLRIIFVQEPARGFQSFSTNHLSSLPSGVSSILIQSSACMSLDILTAFPMRLQSLNYEILANPDSLSCTILDLNMLPKTLISLSFHGITMRNLQSISEFASLKVLNISSCDVTNLFPFGLLPWSLEHFVLQRNSISNSLNSMDWSSMPNLTNVDVSDNPLLSGAVYPNSIAMNLNVANTDVTFENTISNSRTDTKRQSSPKAISGSSMVVSNRYKCTCKLLASLRDYDFNGGRLITNSRVKPVCSNFFLETNMDQNVYIEDVFGAPCRGKNRSIVDGISSSLDNGKTVHLSWNVEADEALPLPQYDLKIPLDKYQKSCEGCKLLLNDLKSRNSLPILSHARFYFVKILNTPNPCCLPATNHCIAIPPSVVAMASSSLVVSVLATNVWEINGEIQAQHDPFPISYETLPVNPLNQLTVKTTRDTRMYSVSAVLVPDATIPIDSKVKATVSFANGTTYGIEIPISDEGIDLFKESDLIPNMKVAISSPGFLTVEFSLLKCPHYQCGVFRDNVVECKVPEIGFYKSTELKKTNEMCEECPSGVTTTSFGCVGEKKDCCSISAKGFYMDLQTHKSARCNANWGIGCPVPGLDSNTVKIKDTYWRTDSQGGLLETFKCPIDVSCTGTPEKCANGFDGVLCLNCARNYYSSFRDIRTSELNCYQCNSFRTSSEYVVIAIGASISLIALLVVVLYLCQIQNGWTIFPSGHHTHTKLLFYWRHSGSNKLRIYVGFLQIFFIQSHYYFPVSVSIFSRWCTIDINPYVLYFILPAISLFILGLLALLNRLGKKSIECRAYKSKVTLMILFLVFPYCFNSLTSMLECVDINFGKYLKLDYRTACYDKNVMPWPIFSTTACICILMWMLVAFIRPVWTHRRVLGLGTWDPMLNKQMGIIKFIYSPYTNKCFWFELFELVRKCTALLIVIVVPIHQPIWVETNYKDYFTPPAAWQEGPLLYGIVSNIVPFLLLLFIQPYRNRFDFSFAISSLLIMSVVPAVLFSHSAIFEDWILLLGFSLETILLLVLICADARHFYYYPKRLDDVRGRRVETLRMDETLGIKIESQRHLFSLPPVSPPVYIGTNSAFDYGEELDESSQNECPEIEYLLAESSSPRFLVPFGSIGNGSGGVVEVAIDSQSFDIVAIKTVSMATDEGCRLVDGELDALKNNKCDEIIGYRGAFFDRASRNARMIFDFMDCGSLQDLIEDSTTIKSNPMRKSFPSGMGPPVTVTRLSEPVLAVICCDLLTALAFLHSNSYLHLDLKPANILLSSDGHCKLADFGLATSTIDGFASTASFKGTLKYLSPERIRGEDASTASDIWAFGLSILVCLTGKYPFSVDETENTTSEKHFYWNLLEKMNSGNEVDVPSTLNEIAVPPPLVNFLKCCLKLNPEERYSAEALLGHPWLVNRKSEPRSYCTDNFGVSSTLLSIMVGRLLDRLGSDSTPRETSVIHIQENKLVNLSSQLELSLDIIRYSFLVAAGQQDFLLQFDT